MLFRVRNTMRIVLGAQRLLRGRRAYFVYNPPAPPSHNWSRSPADPYITQVENALRTQLQLAMSPAQLRAIDNAIIQGRIEFYNGHFAISTKSLFVAVPTIYASTYGASAAGLFVAMLWSAGHTLAHIVFDGSLQQRA